MPVNSAVGSVGDFLTHYTGIRMRVTGGGILRPTMFGQDDITTYTLPTLTLAATSRFNPFVLANVIEQRAHLQIQTTAINDDFTINRIILFARTVFTQFPQ